MELQELLDNLNNSVSTSYDGNVDKVLEQVGLQQRQSTRDVVLPALGIFGAGIAVGATLGMLFAPKRGDELRTDLRQNLEDLREKSAEEYNQLREKSEEALKAARERVSEEAQREGASSPSPGEKKTDGSARSSTGS
jgi:gas vesicle protein